MRATIACYSHARTYLDFSGHRAGSSSVQARWNGDVSVLIPTLFRSNEARRALTVGIAALLAGPAAATETSGRYTMQPTEGGVVRLDRETGAMSFCSGVGGNWTCKAMPEAEEALRKRIEQLEVEKRALEAGQHLRDEVPPDPTAKAPDAIAPPDAELAPPPPPGDLPVPTEKDVDKLFDYVEGMVKKFKERIDRLEREAQKEPEVPL